MYSDVAAWGKREFGGSYFELTVKLSQMAEDNLLDLDLRRDASCLYGFLSRPRSVPLSSATNSNSVKRLIVFSIPLPRR